MGAPSINISFIEKAISVITRGDRGVVLLWVKDALPEKIKNPITIVTAKDIPDGITNNTIDQIKLSMIGYINAPKKVVVYFMDILEDADEGAIENGYRLAMDASETIKFDYLAIPTVETDGKSKDVSTWIKHMRDVKKKKIKAVLPNTAADHEGIINFTTQKNIQANTIVKDGIRQIIETEYSAESYCARIAGLIAGTPITISCTNAPLPELSDCQRLNDIDSPVDGGEFILFYDGEKVKVVRGVNSLVTTTQTKGDSFKKIKLVEAMDMINDDIVRTTQDSYLGRYANTYSNKCLLISAISTYLSQLKKDGIISSYIINLDADAIRTYLKSKGQQAVFDDGTIEDVDECSDDKIITANTGSNVFLIGNIKILDALEDVSISIYI